MVVDGRGALGLRFNEYVEEDGPIVFHHACKRRLEGIVSSRKEFLARNLVGIACGDEQPNCTRDVLSSVYGRFTEGFRGLLICESRGGCQTKFLHMEK